MFCCSGFRNLLSCAGERGYAILVCEISPGEVRFVLQSRGLAFGDEAKWKPVQIEVNINVSAEIGLQFCPFCGRTLKELVNEQPDVRQHLAQISNLLGD